MRRQELETEEHWNDLFTMVDEPIWALENFLDLMGEEATRRADQDLEKQVYIAQTLLKDAVAKIKSRTKQVEAKLGGGMWISGSGAKIIKVKASPPESKKEALAKMSDTCEIPDFRTVQPESEKEAQLQRVFEVMHLGGPSWGFLERAITEVWEDNMWTVEKLRAIWEEGRIQRAEEPEQAAEGSAEKEAAHV